MIAPVPACSFLEDELARRYREAAPSTLSLLQERCDAASAELVAVEVKLRAAEDVGALRRAAMKFSDVVSKQVGFNMPFDRATGHGCWLLAAQQADRACALYRVCMHTHRDTPSNMHQVGTTQSLLLSTWSCLYAACCMQVSALLNGSTEPDPAQHGMTTDEERAASRLGQVGLQAALHTFREALHFRISD